MCKNNQISQSIVDGNVVAVSDARIGMTSRLTMYGEGCFDTLRSYQGGFLCPELHRERLERAMTYLGLNVPEVFRTDNGFLEVLRRFLQANHAMDRHVRIRIQIWSNDHTTGYLPGKRMTRYLVIGVPIPDTPNRPDSVTPQNTPNRPDIMSGISDSAATLITSRYRRVPASALPADVKWCNGINYILAASEAQQQKADDALMLTQNGWVGETTISNIFWKEGDTAYTPDGDCDILPGITRNLLIDWLREMGVVVHAGKFFPDDLYRADMVWACNSVRELYSVIRIDHQHYEPDPVFWEKMCAYFQERKQKIMHYVR